MALNLQMSYTDDSRERKVVSTADVTSFQEGLALAAEIEGGIEKVKPAAAGDEVVGFVYGNMFRPNEKVEIVEVAIDAEGKASVETATPIVAESTGVAVDGVALSEGVTETTNKIEIVSADNAGKIAVVTFKRKLTADEVEILFGSKRINGCPNALFEQVTMMKGNGEIWTDQFDTSADWTSAKYAKAGDNGLIPSDTATNLRVIGLPTAGLAFLGLAVNLA